MKVLVILCCVASVIGQTKYCCTPPQWESYNYFMQGKADHGKVSVISVSRVSKGREYIRVLSGLFCLYCVLAALKKSPRTII